MTSIQRRYEAAVSRENLLRRSYEQQKGTTTQQTRDQIDLLAMTQELETNRQRLNTLLQRQREFQLANGDRSNEVSIATYSRLPKDRRLARRASATFLSPFCCRWLPASVWRFCLISLMTL